MMAFLLIMKIKVILTHTSVTSNDRFIVYNLVAVALGFACLKAKFITLVHSPIHLFFNLKLSEIGIG